MPHPFLCPRPSGIRLAAGVLGAVAILAPAALAADREEVALYVRDVVLPKLALPPVYDDLGLWLSDGPLPGSGSREMPILFQNSIYEPASVVLPFPRTWVAMVDLHPGANWSHGVYHVFIAEDESGDLVADTGLAPIDSKLPGRLLGDLGFGPELPFDCYANHDLGLFCHPLVPPEGYDAGELFPPDEGGPAAAAADPCVRAVIIAGCGWAGQLREDYAKNVSSMYGKLRTLGVPKANITVIFADGREIKVNGANVVNKDAKTKATVRTAVKDAAAAGNAEKDILLVYMSGHGLYKTTGKCDDKFTGLWLWTGSTAITADEVYTAQEFNADLANTKAKRIVVIADQCHSGAFLAATGASGVPTYVSTAATLDCPSWGRQYMAKWEALDPATTTLAKMHPASLDGGTNKWPCPCTGGTGATKEASSPAGSGNFRLNQCFGPEVAPNDTCQKAKVAKIGETAFDTAGALTSAPLVGGCATGQATFDSDLWFSHTATCTGKLTVDVCTANFDTVLAVYPGVACPTDSTASLACDDDGCNKQSKVTLCVKAGDKLLIRVGGLKNAVGTGKLKIACVAGGTPFGDGDCPSCFGDLNGDFVVDGADLGILLANWESDDDLGDLNGDGLVGSEDLGALLASWGPCSRGR